MFRKGKWWGGGEIFIKKIKFGTLHRLEIPVALFEFFTQLRKLHFPSFFTMVSEISIYSSAKSHLLFFFLRMLIFFKLMKMFNVLGEFRDNMTKISVAFQMKI